MDEQATRLQLAAKWPLMKAMAEGKTVMAKLKDTKGAVWTKIEPQENMQFNIDRVDYRIKEDLSEAIIKVVDEAIKAAWNAQDFGAVTRLTNTTRSEIRKLFEENK